MWTIAETKVAAKALSKLPENILRNYAAWCAIVRAEGPTGLRAIKGFHDEALGGKLKGSRSSRLSIQWRIIYSVKSEVVTVTVEQVTPHVYRP